MLHSFSFLYQVGPPGATCVGGKWRPLDLPQCLLGQHPRLRWNRRRRRSLQLRQLRSVYLLRRQRELQRKLLEHEEHKNQLLQGELRVTRGRLTLYKLP